MCTGMTSYNKPEMNKSTTVAILATICRDVCIYGCTNNRCGLDEPELDERILMYALQGVEIAPEDRSGIDDEEQKSDDTLLVFCEKNRDALFSLHAKVSA